MDASLVTRIKTASLVLIPVIAALFLGGVWLKCLLILIFAAINWELLAVSPQIAAPQRRMQWLLLFLLPAGYLFGGPSVWAMALLFAAIFSFILEVLTAENDRHEVSQLEPLVIIGLSLAYTGTLGSMLFAAVDAASRAGLFWLLFTVIAADSGAYFTGRAIGGAKLAPRLSPNKTVSGAIGGILGAGIVSVGLCYAFSFVAHPVTFFCWGALVGVLAIFGDLFKSLIKRTFGVKDFGNLLPGHGGILDRVDALLFAAPVLFFVSGANL